MIDQRLAALIREEFGDWSDEEEDDEEEDAKGDNDDGTGKGDKEGEGESEDEEDGGSEHGNNGSDKTTPPDFQYEEGYYANWPKMAFYLTSLDSYPAERTYRWWSKTIAAGRRNGIQVSTRTTKPPKRNNDYGFHVQWPEGVADNILETSPWHGHPSLPKVYFKPHVGFVEDCEHCGDCDECFECYPPEVWATIKKEESEEGEAGGEGEELDRFQWAAQEPIRVRLRGYRYIILSTTTHLIIDTLTGLH
jgi:hypothetical protein